MFPTTADANLANLEVKSTEFSDIIDNNCLSTSDPFDWTLSSFRCSTPDLFEWWSSPDLFGVDPEEPEPEEAERLNNEDKSGIQESFDTALEGDVGGVGRTRGGVCNTELKMKTGWKNLNIRGTNYKTWVKTCPSKNIP